MAVRQHGVPKPYESSPLSGPGTQGPNAGLPVDVSSQSPVDAALQIARARQELELATALMGHHAGHASTTTQAEYRGSSDAALIQSFLARANSRGDRVTLTPAGTSRLTLPAGLNAATQPALTKIPEATSTVKEDGNFLTRHWKGLGATALVGSIIFSGAINFIPPINERAHTIPGIEKLIFVGDRADTTTVVPPTPENITGELVSNLPNMTAVAEPILDKPLLITKPLEGQKTSELSQHVNLSYTSPGGKQTTLDNMLRLTAPNVLLGALNFQIDPKNLDKNLNYAGDGNYELKLDAINPQAILNSGIKPDGTLISDADLKSANPPKLVILGGNNTDLAWKAVIEAGNLEGSADVEKYITETYGNDAEAITKALQKNGLSIASHMSKEAVSDLLSDPMFFQAVISKIQDKINGFANSNLPVGESIKVTITFDEAGAKAFIDKAGSAYKKYDKPLKSGVDYKGKLSGLAVPTLDKDS